MKTKNPILTGTMSSVLSALIVGGITFVMLSNSYAKKHNQLQFQIFELRTENDLLKKQNEETKLILSAKQDEPKDSDPVSSSVEIQNAACDYWKKRDFAKTDGYDAAGTVKVLGSIIQRIEDAAWDEEKKVTSVYFVFSNPENTSQQLFYDHYMEMAKGGNTINSFDGENLLFKLGLKIDSGLLTTAGISNELSSLIVSLIDTGKTVELEITARPPVGRGAEDWTIFACSISDI